jgi:hypothetical protein
LKTFVFSGGFPIDLPPFSLRTYHVDLAYHTRKRLLYVYKYPDAVVKIWTDKMKSGGKLTDEEIEKIFAYTDAANNDNLIESLDKYF